MLQLCDLLEAYLTWKQVEKVFWTWMVGLIHFSTYRPFTTLSIQDSSLAIVMNL